jgi:hypothetical protein
MEKLIEYLNTGKCIAFIGAGPSAETLIPAWGHLAQTLFDTVSKLYPDKISKVRENYDIKKWPEFFGDVEREIGRDFLYSSCQEILKDLGQRGAVYSFLAKFPFQSYFTTNFDDVLKRHLRSIDIHSSMFLNKKENFQDLDIDTLQKSIVKIHGDFSDLSTIVLTDHQYDEREVGDKYQYYRDFLSSYFHLKRFLFVGYSVNDPDIQSILKRIGINLRRKIPMYAVVADARDSTVREWDRKYNIQVIRYNNNSGTHQELRGIFQALEKYLNLDGPPPPPRTDLDLKRAQSFYMWHRFQMGDPSLGLQVDALKSVVLSSIQMASKTEGSFDAKQISLKITEQLGESSPELEESTRRCLNTLKEDGLIIENEPGLFSATPSLGEVQSKYDRQYERMQSAFDEQVGLDFRKTFESISLGEVEQVKKAVRDVIVDLFSERGLELVNMVFSKRRVNVVQASNLFRLLNRRAQDISSIATRYGFVAYVTDMLTAPTAIQESVLEYYSSAFFSMQALQIDPQGERFRREFLRNRTILVDSNVLIPLLAKYSAKQEVFERVLLAAKEQGLHLVTTENMVAELMTHIRWAQDHINRSGEQSEEVLSAALGRPPYRRNAFLDGFIRYCADIRRTDFEGYLTLILGGNRTERSISTLLSASYGIPLFDFNAILVKQAESGFAKDTLVDFIRQMANQADITKTDLRMRCEAEAYSIIRYWGILRPPDIQESEWECSLLSQGGFLNRIARESEFPLDKNIIIRIDALYEFLLRFGSPKRKELAFKDVLLSSYFRSAEYFVDKTKYRKFFSSLINEAERTYEEGLEDFKKYVDANLTTNSMDDVIDFERPMVIAALQETLHEKIHQKDDTIAELTISLEVQQKKLHKAESDLGQLKAKKGRMDKYAKAQRRQQEKLKKKGR